MLYNGKNLKMTDSMKWFNDFHCQVVFFLLHMNSIEHITDILDHEICCKNLLKADDFIRMFRTHSDIHKNFK